MLTEHDLAFIRNNRAEILENRTEEVIIIHVTPGTSDPYTGEQTGAVKTPETVAVTWKEYSTVANGDRDVIGGVELRQDDVKVSFDASVDLSDVEHVVRGDVTFEIVAIDEKGIGGRTRWECVARRVV